MPQSANKNPWSAWASQYLPGTYAHPDAPCGGTGPGYSRPAGPSGTSFADVGVADPQSPEGNEITPAQAQAEYANYELTKAKNAVRDATTWGKLRIVAEQVLGPQSFGLGVAYGIAKNPVMSAAQLMKLQKIFIEADIYERLTRRTSSWKQLLMGMAYSNPAVVPIMSYLVRSGKITIEDLKRSYEMREGLIKEVGDVFAHPLDFFAKAKDQLKVNYVEKWERFCRLRAQTDLKSQFEAGEIFGDVLMEVAMLVLTVVSVAGAAAKLAAKVPQLVRIAEFVRGVRAAEVGGVVGEEVEAGKVGSAVPQAAKQTPPLKCAPPLVTDVSSKAKIAATPNRTTTVLGVYEPDMKAVVKDVGLGKNVDFGAKPGSYNVLDVPDKLYKPATFWDEYNQPWLQKAVERGDNFIMASDPTVKSNLVRINNITQVEEATGFAKEVEYLKKAGYIYDGSSKMMTKP